MADRLISRFPCAPQQWECASLQKSYSVSLQNDPSLSPLSPWTIIIRPICPLSISCSQRADFVYSFVQTLYVHTPVKNFRVNVFPQRFFKTFFCNLFILHILTPGVFYTVIATMAIYIDHLLRHVSKISLIRKTKHIWSFQGEFHVCSPVT